MRALSLAAQPALSQEAMLAEMIAENARLKAKVAAIGAGGGGTCSPTADAPR